MYTVNYEDGEIETVDLSKEKFRIIGGVKRSNNTSGDENNTTSAAAATKSVNNTNKRRRILEDSEDDDEEMEFESEEEDGGDDTGSEFKMNGDESMDDSLDVEEDEGGDDTDNWLASEDEDEDFQDKKPKSIKKKKTAMKVTQVVGRGGNDDRGRFVSPTPRKVTGNAAAKKSSTNDMSTMDFSNFASQSPTQGSSKKNPVNNSNSSNNVKSSSPMSQTNNNSTNNNNNKNAPPKPIAGVVNSAGSHLHNHLKFFTTNRKDGHGHPTTHPDYSPRSLQVSLSEIERESGSKVSPAQKQWWDIKSQYADCVLLFKTGKFYEMFHDDADVGVKVLGFVYMKGTLAHAGFPEAAYDKMLTKLVDAGYRVARVEQTETPDALKERKKKAPTGKKPQVVCREICSITTKGTRTYCFLEDASCLEKDNGGGGNGRGPLLTIKEIMLEDSDGDEMMEGEEDESGTKAVCEYGVTIVDAVTGAVTMGQFADDVLRSRMQTLLASFGPSEVSSTIRDALFAFCAFHLCI